jgi:hypothetical protein
MPNLLVAKKKREEIEYIYKRAKDKEQWQQLK